MTVVAVINQKGGVGKTTTAAHLAHGLALRGQHVCAMDLDPQGQLARALGVDDRGAAGSWGVLTGQLPLRSAMLRARPGLDLIPAGARLAELETISERGPRAGRRLAEALMEAGLDRDRDTVVLDCPPSGSMLTMNAIIAADLVLVPVAADPLALDATHRLIAIVRHICARLQLPVELELLLTRFHRRRRICGEVRSALQARYGDALLPVSIHEGVALAASAGSGRTVFETARTSRAAADHDAFIDIHMARELRRRATRNAPAVPARRAIGAGHS